MRALILITVVILSACTADTSDLQVYVEQVKQRTPVSIEPYPEFKSMPAFSYTASNMRSPFERIAGSNIEVVEVAKANCLQPDANREKQPLERYGIDALSIQGTFSSSGKMWALVLTNDGKLHRVTRGDKLGLFYGTVLRIQGGVLEFEELLPDGTGCWQKKQASLSMAGKAGEQDNV